MWQCSNLCFPSETLLRATNEQIKRASLEDIGLLRQERIILCRIVALAEIHILEAGESNGLY